MKIKKRILKKKIAKKKINYDINNIKIYFYIIINLFIYNMITKNIIMFIFLFIFCKRTAYILDILHFFKTIFLCIVNVKMRKLCFSDILAYVYLRKTNNTSIIIYILVFLINLLKLRLIFNIMMNNYFFY